MHLPPAQRRVLDEVSARCREPGDTVGVTELAEHFGYSKVTAYEHLRQLVNKGAVSMVPKGRGSHHRYALPDADLATLIDAAAVLRALGHRHMAGELVSVVRLAQAGKRVTP